MDEPARPDVILDVVFEEGLFFLVLRNIGARPALAVSTAFGRPLPGLRGTKDIAALPLFRRLEFLAPGREIRTLLDSSASSFRRRQGRGSPRASRTATPAGSATRRPSSTTSPSTGRSPT